MSLSLPLLAPILCAAALPHAINEPEVTHMAFSPDGKALTAAYFRRAINRPGTNWSSFAVTWDLATGRQTFLPHAIGPVAYSPDGKTLATGLAEPNRRPPHRTWPYVRLALWAPGESRPTTVLTAPSDPGQGAIKGEASQNGSVLAFAFHPGGKHLAVAAADQLWWQPLGGTPQAVASLRLVPQGVLQDTTRLAFDRDGKLLRLAGLASNGQGGRERRVVITWEVESGDKGTKFTELSREEPKDRSGKSLLGK